MPTVTTDWLVDSFRQPNAALLATIGPQVCTSTGSRCDPCDPQWFAAAGARRLQLTTYFPQQVSYGQHVTPQISWSGSRQRNAIACRRSVAAIGLESKKAVVWHRELRFDHLPDQLVFIVQELHHFERGWGGSLARGASAELTQWLLKSSKPPTLASIRAVSNRVARGLFHGTAIPPQFQTTD